MDELYRTEELRIRERLGRAGLPPGTLMQRAGEAAARAIDAFLRAGPLAGRTVNTRSSGAAAQAAAILVLCGAGDNGGDGFVCALALQQRGYRCTCWAPMPSGSADAQAARQRWQAAAGAIVENLPAQDGFDCVVDALLGIGVSRPLGGAILAALHWTRQRAPGLPVVALNFNAVVVEADAN